jgi:hypothetical protein
MRHISIVRAVLFAISLSSVALAQHGLNDIPNRDYDENLTDEQKLTLLTRKAHYERDRAANFAARGISGYVPTRDSLYVAMPMTARRGNRRLAQLNRIRKHADKATRVWIDWEFDVVRKRTIWLINNGR